ncbi:MAG: hypothetical protein U1E56_04545 [Bauldia sp.]
MASRLQDLMSHDDTEDCVVCRSRELVSQIVVPATAAWETTLNLPRCALALHGAAGLLATMLAEGFDRDALQDAVTTLLDEIEEQVAEDRAMGGPPQGTA